VLLAAGAVVAITQPGDLGDQDTAASVRETTTSTTETEPATTTTAEAPTAAPTTTSTVAGDGTTTTTIAGSGLGTASPPSGGSDGIADTGGESMIGAGLGLLALGLLLRRAARAPQP
jgi:hypothetical protein